MKRLGPKRFLRMTLKSEMDGRRKRSPREIFEGQVVETMADILQHEEQAIDRSNLEGNHSIVKK